MVNKNLFKSRGIVKSVPQTNCMNEAGAPAYAFEDKHALAQYAVTGTFHGVFYADESTQLKRVEELCQKVDSEFLAKLAVYSRLNGKMKDMPAFFCAVLAARGETKLLEQIFDKAIDNSKMLCNFVQIIRSGALGRKSFGTAVKRCIQTWLIKRGGKALFNASIGHSDPSLADIIKMVHPRPRDKFQQNIFGYLIGKKDYKEALLPEDLQIFEQLKRGEISQVPNLPFRCLTNCNLDVKQWQSVALNMPWDTLRQNINQLNRKGVFVDTYKTGFLNDIVNKITDADAVRKHNVFPFQIMTTYKNLESDVPHDISLAYQQAMEIAKENVPIFDGKTLIAIDVSGSMRGGGVMGNGTGNTQPIDVAALMASIFLSQNKTTEVVAFHDSIMMANLNPFDSIVRNTECLVNIRSGGTNLSLVFQYLNEYNRKFDQVIVLSDNQSWLDNYIHNGTNMWEYSGQPNLLWAQYSQKNHNCRLVCVDLQPYANTKVCDKPGKVLNIGGFSSSVFDVIKEFCNGDKTDFVGIVEQTELS